MATDDDGEEEPPGANAHQTIPTVIVNEAESAEGAYTMDEDKGIAANGGVTPRSELEEEGSIGDSVDQSQTMNQDMDFSVLSLNFLNEQGTGLAQGMMPDPPDGGYGWVIVIAAFCSNLIVDGVCNSFSELKPAFIEHFNSSETSTALIGSLLIAVYLLVGPIVGGLVNKYGSRKVVVIGALISGTAFMLANLSPNIVVFMGIYGVMGGIGFGMIYLPAIVCVGYYFESKRAVATGIAVAGSGVGTIIMPVLTEHLVSTMGWAYTMYVIAALVFLCALFGLLYRPLEQTSTPLKKISTVHPEDRGDVEMELLKQKLAFNDEEDEADEPPKRAQSHTTRTSEWIDTSSKVLAEGAGLDDEVMVKLRNVLSDLDESPTPENPSGEATGTTSPVNVRQPLSPITEGRDHSASFKNRASTNLSQNPNTVNPRSRKMTLTSLASDMYSTTDLKSRASSRNNLSGGLSRISARSIAQSMSRLSTGKGGASTLSIAMTGVDPQEFVKPLNRKDIFYGGSIRNLKEFNDEGKNVAQYRESMLSIPASVLSRAASKLSVNGDLAESGNRIGGSRMSRVTGGLAPEEELELYYDDSKFKWIPLSIRNAFNEMIDLQLLKDPVMLLLCLSNLLGMMGFYIPFMYLKSLAIEGKVEATDARYLVPLIGVTNTFGRVFFGWMADRGYVTALAINNFSLISCGVLTALCPLFSSFAGLAVYSCLFGFIISAYICLTSIVLSDLLGLEKLTNSFGLLVVARGIASLIGAPFAGLVYDITKSYSMSFYFAGGMIIISGIISCGIPFVHRWKRSVGENEEDVEKDDIDAMSGKLSVLTERSEENLTEYQRTIQSLRQQHALLKEVEEEKKRISATKEKQQEPIGEADNEEDAEHTALLEKKQSTTEEPSPAN